MVIEDAMMTKLILRIDEHLIEQAETYGRAHGKSVSGSA